MTQEKQNDAKLGLQKLANTKMDLSLIEWNKISNDILTELERAQWMQRLLKYCHEHIENGYSSVTPEIREAIKDALSDAPTIKPQYGEWLPIESAPKDEDILVCQSQNNIIKTARGVNSYGHWKIGSEPMSYIVCVTHWMPLPDLPDAPKKGQNDE